MRAQRREQLTGVIVKLIKMAILLAVIVMAMGAPDGPGTSTYKKFNCRGCCGSDHVKFTQCTACDMTGHLSDCARRIAS